VVVGFALTGDRQTPAVLVAVEPWFVVGGLAFGGLARSQLRRDGSRNDR
jgi:hypothetical protein